MEYVMDRTGWCQGPWDHEPDRVEWRHEGMPCLIVRSHLGALCGYVGVPPEHPLHGKHYDATELIEIDVHGGLTYSAHCRGAICHVPRPGEPADVWWFGFDCAHYMDIVPGYRDWPDDPDQVYRDIAYVRQEAESLARQLKRMRELEAPRPGRGDEREPGCDEEPEAQPQGRVIAVLGRHQAGS